MIIANDVSDPDTTFGSEQNAVHLITEAQEQSLPWPANGSSQNRLCRRCRDARSLILAVLVGLRAEALTALSRVCGIFTLPLRAQRIILCALFAPD